MAELKPGWQRVKFGELANCINDRVDNPSTAGVDRYVGLEHLDPESLTIRRWGSPEDVESTKLRFKPRDIIFGKRRAYQRKLAVADFEGICSAHAMVLRAKPDVILPEFLPFFMQSDLFMERAVEVSVGSLSPTINWKTLAQQEFALPPLEEQRRMVEPLVKQATLLSRWKELKTSAEKARRAYLLDVFESPKCQFMPAEDIGSVTMGRQRAPRYQDGPQPRRYLRVANVFDGFIDESDVLSMHFSDSEFEKYRLLPGDVLLNEGQSRHLVGRSAIVGNLNGDYAFQNTLIRFRASQVEPEYAHAFFQYCLYSGKFAKIASQTTSIAHLGVSRFAQLLVPVLPADKRHEFIEGLQVFNVALREFMQRDRELQAFRSALMCELVAP
jgi:type I restriction enzyme S subunit